MNELSESVSAISAIDLQGLNKSFGANHVLRNVDLSIKHGERFALFGPNGAGKTTLIKIMSTLVQQSSGSVKINGINTRQKPEAIRRYLGVIGHHTFLYDNLSVYDNLKFYGRMYGVNNLEQRIREVINRVELEIRLYDKVSTLSRGMQQRVSLARAIIHKPTIMFLDEPEVGLDSRAVDIMFDILNSKENVIDTVFMTTHNLDRGMEICDRLAILNRGEFVYQAFKRDIDIANFKSTYKYYTGVTE
jgi:ABC-type multidrug transport system ATPase subunit